MSKDKPQPMDVDAEEFERDFERAVNEGDININDLNNLIDWIDEGGRAPNNTPVERPRTPLQNAKGASLNENNLERP